MMLEITTTDIDKFTRALEHKGTELAEHMLRRVKRHHEHQRRLGYVRFRRIRRLKSGKRRFVAKKPPIEKAEVIGKSFAAHFHDIFNE